ncbi:hypothetical protein [Bradyrhizobium sp. USDA 3686]
MDRRKFMVRCLSLPLLAQVGATRAQAGLTKIIFPFAAGAGGDTLCRLIAQEMAPALQRTIVVENRTGGDGLIGIKAVKGGKPRRQHGAGDDRTHDVPAADGRDDSELRCCKGFRPGLAAGAL